jgi:hypothetical protein
MGVRWAVVKKVKAGVSHGLSPHAQCVMLPSCCVSGQPSPACLRRSVRFGCEVRGAIMNKRAKRLGIVSGISVSKKGMGELFQGTKTDATESCMKLGSAARGNDRSGDRARHAPRESEAARVICPGAMLRKRSMPDMQNYLQRCPPHQLPVLVKILRDYIRHHTTSTPAA